MFLTFALAPPVPLFGKFVYAAVMAALAAMLTRKDCNAFSLTRLLLAWCGCGLIVVLLEYLPISRQDQIGVLDALAGFLVALMAFRLPMPWIDAGADLSLKRKDGAGALGELPKESTPEHLAAVVGKVATYLLCGP